MGLFLGILAFLLFFLHDWNDWKGERKSLRICFPAGVLCLVLGTFFLSRTGESPFSGWVRGLFGTLGLLFLCLLIYTLFFALPAAASYAKPGEERPVETRGVYALCRHPGVLWFIGLFLCLYAATGVPLFAVLLFSFLNLLLVVFEDRWVFPHTLQGYQAYRRTTPFLLPNGKSLRACCHSPGER